ncbi:hypothetical protein CROQUDRAFT_659730 [Cronartium quercuum f. sp. fusiforme G11]|uniref:Uncharacterized protein n=1 Tax=Cronartium quercuum f. sp. fusiforme G11 TaxID=708437 RepID=A0A9P6NIJ9_9BASI|nr:hypothetical protein CROQUDRAFT_659730 [Cronartium quercuum f. sp. fusiforme G11]
MVTYQNAIVNFAMNVPTGHNPYIVVAHHLVGLLVPPPIATWARWLQRVVIAGYLVMFIQSCRLTYMGLKRRSYQRVGFDELGIIYIDSITASGIAYTLYASLVITDLILDEVISSGKNAVAVWIIVYGYKFLILYYLGLSFLWTCARHCASLQWKSPRHIGPSFGRSNIPKLAPWIMHLILIVFFFWPIAPVIYQFAAAKNEYNLIKNIVLSVNQELLQSAGSFSPKSYKNYQLLVNLVPLQSVIGHVAFTPFLFYALQGLYRYRKSEFYYSDTLVMSNQDNNQELRLMANTTQKKRKLVVSRVLLAYTGYLVQGPVMTWQLATARDWFFLDPNWLIGSHLGLHGPQMISGNITLFLLVYTIRMHAPSCKDNLPTIRMASKTLKDPGTRNKATPSNNRIEPFSSLNTNVLQIIDHTEYNIHNIGSIETLLQHDTNHTPSLRNCEVMSEKPTGLRTTFESDIGSSNNTKPIKLVSRRYIQNTNVLEE